MPSHGQNTLKMYAPQLANRPAHHNIKLYEQMPEAIEEQHRALIDEALQHMSASFRFHRWRDQVGTLSILNLDLVIHNRS